MHFDQGSYDIRCEWGLEGIRALGRGSRAIVIVDVFSFTTAVDIAVVNGAAVYPFAGPREEAEAFAREKGAILAASRRGEQGMFSLSPSSLLRLPTGASVVLPSPNGSTLSLATGDTPTFAACLRNARAVARAAMGVGLPVSVIPAGERWQDGSLRPGLEDLLGTGAVIHELEGTRSPEAEAAEGVFLRFMGRIGKALERCGSGKEVEERRGPEDVRLAGELNVSGLAPRLVEGRYVG